MQRIDVFRCDNSYLKDIIQLEQGFEKERYSCKMIEDSLNDNNVIYFILKVDDKVCGYLSASTVLDECELLKIIIDEKYRHMGLGSKLLDNLIEYLQKNDYRKIFLEVRADNLNAKLFYKKNGFEMINQRKKYYKDGVDADIYWLNLNVKH